MRSLPIHVCILEAMKMMSEIPAPMDCVIEEVLMDNGSLAALTPPCSGSGGFKRCFSVY